MFNKSAENRWTIPSYSQFRQILKRFIVMLLQVRFLNGFARSITFFYRINSREFRFVATLADH